MAQGGVGGGSWAAFIKRLESRCKARGFLPLGFEAFVRDVFAELATSTKEHGRQNIPRFGVFVRNDRPPRRVKLPRGGAADVGATWSIGFRSGRGARGKRT